MMPFAWIFFLAAALHAGAGEAAAPASSHRKHFFIHLVSHPPPPGFSVEVANLTKSAHNPLLSEADAPWDMAWWNTYPSVLYDPTVPEPGGARPFKLYYNGMQS